MKVTTKGQVTIPQDIRDRMGIRPGTEIRFVIEGNAVRLIPVKGSGDRGRKLVSRIRGRASVSMTTDEIMALTRDE